MLSMINKEHNNGKIIKKSNCAIVKIVLIKADLTIRLFSIFFQLELFEKVESDLIF